MILKLCPPIPVLLTVITDKGEKRYNMILYKDVAPMYPVNPPTTIGQLSLILARSICCTVESVLYFIFKRYCFYIWYYFEFYLKKRRYLKIKDVIEDLLNSDFE